MFRIGIRKKILLGVECLFLFFVAMGCGGGGINTAFEDGKVYVLNNLHSCVRGNYTKGVWVLYEGRQIDIPFHLDPDTKEILPEVEPTLITEEPFKGGTTVEFVVRYMPRQGVVDLPISITIDGTITVELIPLDWDNVEGLATFRIVSGRYTGSHVY